MLVFGQHCIGGGDEQEALLPTDSNTLPTLFIFKLYIRIYKGIYLVICAK